MSEKNKLILKYKLWLIWKALKGLKRALIAKYTPKWPLNDLKKVKVTFLGQMDVFFGLRRQNPIGKEVFIITLTNFYFFEKLAKNTHFDIFKLAEKHLPNEFFFPLIVHFIYGAPWCTRKMLWKLFLGGVHEGLSHNWTTLSLE